MTRRLWILGLAIWLAGCATQRVRPASEPSAAHVAQGERLLSERESALFERENFDLSGRIAISDGHDGGSGRFEWEQRGRAFSLRFYAPISAQNWRLEVQPGQALLIESNGAVRVASSAEELLARELNWNLPADALRYWVLGMRAPGAESVAEYADDGRLASLKQRGWEIRYIDFDRDGEPPLPRKLYARSGDHQVRISVRRWNFR